MFGIRSARLVSVAVVFGALLALMPSAASAKVVRFTGTIASGPQFDTFLIPLKAGDRVDTRLICEEIAPGNRPLDPVLSVFRPGKSPADTANADFFNDDGFGKDDDPAGVDCSAFDSSRIRFTAPFTGPYTFRADGFGSATGPYSLTIITASDFDFDFDGKADLGVFRGSTAQWFVFGSTTGFPGPVPFGAPGDVPIAFDYDGDGKPDFAVFRPSTSQWFLFGSAAGFPGFIAYGSPGDIPVPADYDADGLADLAFFRPSTGEWFSLLGFRSPIPFGGPGDIPVPADYDGDGEADLAVFRPSTGQWFILPSLASFPPPVPFGAPGDVPVPADYDGDGKADIAVFRPSTGQWFILGSTAGVLGPIPFGAPGLGDEPVGLPAALR
jgi:hypothetical protein